MRAEETQRAIAAAISVAASFGLAVDDAVVLSDSNRLVLRLLPCDIVARVAPATHFASSELEVEVVARLARTDSPAAGLDARVEQRAFERDGFKVGMWTFFEPAPPRVLPPSEYVRGLERLHAGLHQVDIDVPHVMDRVTAIQRDVADRDVTPGLSDDDRALLVDTLGDLQRSIVSRNAPEQLLHGEPHPWNLLDTTSGLLFIDFENTARGPVEYDLAWVPDEVSKNYENADQELVDECRGVVLAIIAAHRWNRDDQHPSGRESGVAFLDALRKGSPYPALDDVVW
jgi:hypothetical protein